MEIYQKRKFGFGIFIFLLGLWNLITDIATKKLDWQSILMAVSMLLVGIDTTIASFTDRVMFDMDAETEAEHKQLVRLNALDTSLEIALVLSLLLKFVFALVGTMKGQTEFMAISLGLTLAHFISRGSEVLTHWYYKQGKGLRNQVSNNDLSSVNKQTVSAVMQKMIDYSEGNLHDIAHFMKVYSFARTIGLQEGVPRGDRITVEIAAILHDIACPLCREKYGNTNGKYQELEGGPLAEAFLKEMDLPESLVDRVVYLVSHHHTYTDVSGIDYRILLEADFLVNADESHMSKEAILKARETFFQTTTGKALLDSIYLSETPAADASAADASAPEDK